MLLAPAFHDSAERTRAAGVNLAVPSDVAFRSAGPIRNTTPPAMTRASREAAPASQAARWSLESAHQA